MPNSGWFKICLLDPGSLILAYNSFFLLTNFFFSQKQGGRHCAQKPALRTQSVCDQSFSNSARKKDAGH
jgi:hypothetical protein